MEKNSIFSTLYSIDVNEHKEDKNGLSYLSWAWAWGEVKKAYPEATYTIWKDEFNRPYVNDPELGIMCFTTVTINGETNEMWLPAMDAKNRAMKTTPYVVKAWNRFKKQYENEEVQAATMFDINKTIMRCLVKNLAMFGLGLYIYAGEDLPEDLSEAPAKENTYEMPEMKGMQEAMNDLVDSLGLDKETMNITPISYAEPKKKTTKKVTEKPDEAPAISDGEVKNTISIVKGFRSRTELKAYIDEHPQYAEYLWFQNNCNEQWKKLAQ